MILCYVKCESYLFGLPICQNKQLLSLGIDMDRHDAEIEARGWKRYQIEGRPRVADLCPSCATMTIASALRITTPGDEKVIIFGGSGHDIHMSLTDP